MANEEKDITKSEKEVDETKVEGVKEEGETKTEGTSDDGEGSSKKEDTDYEAELAKERERTAKAEQAAADKAFKLREAKRKKEDGEDVEGDEEIDEDEPLTKKQLDKVLSKEREKTRKEMQSETIALKAKKLSRSDAEANLIIEIHKNRSFPENLSLDEQLEEAWAIANRKSFVAKNEELKRALKGKETASTDVASTHKDTAPIDEPKANANDVEAIKAAGFVWNGKTRMYEKALKGSRVLVYDPKTKTRRVIGK